MRMSQSGARNRMLFSYSRKIYATNRRIIVFPFTHYFLHSKWEDVNDRIIFPFSTKLRLSLGVSFNWCKFFLKDPYMGFCRYSSHSIFDIKIITSTSYGIIRRNVLSTDFILKHRCLKPSIIRPKVCFSFPEGGCLVVPFLGYKQPVEQQQSRHSYLGARSPNLVSPLASGTYSYF